MPNKNAKDWGAYLYLLPVVIILFIFHVFPIFLTLGVSFYEWDLIGDPKFIGAENYARLIDDPMFWKSIWNTLYYVAVSIPLNIFLSLGIAILLNNPIKGLGIYRTVYYIPVVTSVVAVSIVWNFIYHPDYGPLNKILTTFGIDPIKWLQDPNWAMPAIILMSVWQGLGRNIILFLVGLQNIPKHLYEAARIDGANRWQQFIHITWPMISPTTFFIFTMALIGSFQIFNQVLMMTPRGGPLQSTTVIVYYLYRKAFERFEFGYALAMAFVLFLIIFALSLFNKFYVEKKVHYS